MVPVKVVHSSHPGPGVSIAAAPVDWLELREALRRRAREAGFDVARFAAPRTPPGAEHLPDWLARGCQGEMHWLARDPAKRQDPARLFPPARVILVVGVNYRPPGDPLSGLDQPGRGWVSAHARHQDYHPWLKERLRGLSGWLEERLGMPVAAKGCVDTAPILEKPLAAACGVGWQGKNVLLVSRRHACWLFLGELLLGVPIPPDPEGEVEGDHCGTCTRCLTACPTGAFTAPYRLDPRRCLAYWTIEHGGVIPEELRRPMGNRIYGCDDCLAVCPWDRFAPPTTRGAFLPRGELESPPLAELARLDAPRFRELFRGSSILRIGVERLLRNVAVALGNWGGEGAWEPLLGLLAHPAPLVRRHAAWGLGRLLPRFPGVAGALGERLAREGDEGVAEEIRSALHAGGGSDPAPRWEGGDGDAGRPIPLFREQ